MLTHNGVILPGLDGSTPLGFLAALGVLRVVSHAPDSDQANVARLAWRFEDRWRPVMHGPLSLEGVASTVAEDAKRWESSPVLQFRYPKIEKRGVKLIGAVRPPVGVLRSWLQSRLEAGDTESLEYAAALTAETANESADESKVLTPETLAQYNVAFDARAPLNRSTMATAFDFTSRNAQFLEQVEQMRAELDQPDIEVALRIGSPDRQASRTLDWDPVADAPGAIYGGRFSGFRPALEWLAFRGLAFFPVSGSADRLNTTACTGRRKQGSFTWPIWGAALESATVASLLRYPDIASLTAIERRELGILQVFRAALTKKADGYSGMFAPSGPA